MKPTYSSVDTNEPTLSDSTVSLNSGHLQISYSMCDEVISLCAFAFAPPAIEQKNRGTGKQENRGTEEQGNRGTKEQGNRDQGGEKQENRCSQTSQ